MTTVPADSEPLSQYALMRSTSVRDTEIAGAKLLSSHCLRLIDMSGFDAHINGMAIGGVRLYYMSYGAALAVAAPPMHGFVAICIPLAGAFELKQGHTSFEAEAGRGAAVVASGEPFLMEWSRDLSMFCLRFDMRLLSDFATSAGLRPGRSITFKKDVTCPKILQSLLGSARLAELAAARVQPGRHLPAQLAARIREHMLLTLFFSQPNTLSATLTADHRPVRRAALMKAIDFVESHPPVATPKEVARHAGMSLRALEVQFKDELNTTPSAYILRTRLRHVHEELHTAEAELDVSVTDVARRWGFSNFGRFAQQYRAVYAERPSDTLKGALARRSMSPQAPPASRAASSWTRVVQ